MSDAADRIAIHELINLHGHLVDEGRFDRLGELVTDDVVYDASSLGEGRLVGADAIAEAGRAFGERNPLAHHVTNVVVTQLDGSRARAVSKGLAVMSDGTAASVVYEDELRRTAAGWRIATRRVLARRAPLTPSGAAAPAERG